MSLLTISKQLAKLLLPLAEYSLIPPSQIMLFFAIYDLIYVGFRLLVGENTQFKDVTFYRNNV